MLGSYDINGKNVDISNLSKKEVSNVFEPHHKSNSKLFCLCSCSKPAVYVGRRKGNYFPFKAKNTGELHHIHCRHHQLTPAELASIGLGMGAISSDGEKVIVSLSKSLIQGQEDWRTEKVQYDFGGDIRRHVANKMSLLGLLYLLWERAGLNEWNPNLVKNSLWPDMRRAAYGVQPKGVTDLQYGLSDLLLLPLHAATPNQDERNFAKFKQAKKNKQFLIFTIQLPPARITSLIDTPNLGNPFSLYTDFKVNLLLYPKKAEDLIDGLKNSYASELAHSKNGGDLIIFGIAQPTTTAANNAYITSLALMSVTANHLPIDSSLEQTFATELIKQDRWFKKPLRYEASHDMKMHPDFILLDTQIKTAIEVYGMDTKQYRKRKDEKRWLYRNSTIPYKYWEWDAITNPDLNNWLNKNPLPT